MSIEFNANESPDYYKRGDIECIDAIREAVKGLDGFEGCCTANIIKYMWRWKAKGGIHDLVKAQNYINFLIDYLSKKAEDK